MYQSILPKELPTKELHQILLGTVAPRPIAFVSTTNKNGIPNLAPYSFFNCFSSKPPILVFSSNRRVSNNTTKHTLHNAEQLKEVVINIVSYEIVRQMALTSVEYDEGVNEFEKSGLTAIASDIVKAPRVAESIVNYECKVNDIIALGNSGGAGNLVICEVVKIHINKDIFDEAGKIDPDKANLVARMGRAFYCKASGGNVFPIVQPVNVVPIGWNTLPDNVKQSTILTGNDLGALAGVEKLPAANEIAAYKKEHNFTGNETERHTKAKQLIKHGKVVEAWMILLDD